MPFKVYHVVGCIFLCSPAMSTGSPTRAQAQHQVLPSCALAPSITTARVPEEDVKSGTWNAAEHGAPLYVFKEPSRVELMIYLHASDVFKDFLVCRHRRPQNKCLHSTTCLKCAPSRRLDPSTIIKFHAQSRRRPGTAARRKTRTPPWL